MTARDGRPLRVIPQGPSGTAVTPLDACRDSLAERYPGLDQTCPAALDLAAQLHSDLHLRLTGVASQFAGRRSPAHFREALRAERGIDLVDLAFLAVQPMAEPRGAVAALVADLAHEVGYEAQPVERRPVVLGSACALLIETFGASLGAVERAREDGRIDGTERPRVIAALEELQRRVAELLEAVRQAVERA